MVSVLMHALLHLPQDFSMVFQSTGSLLKYKTIFILRDSKQTPAMQSPSCGSKKASVVQCHFQVNRLIVNLLDSAVHFKIMPINR